MMRTEERQKFIMTVACTEGFVSISDTASKLNVSIETVRRDINRLCESNQLKKIRGGAAPIKLPFRKDNDYLWRKKHNLQEKMAIGAEGASMIRSDSVVALASGASVEAIIPFISGVHNVTFVINSVRSAAILLDRFEAGELDGRIIFIGGELDRKNRFTKGSIVTDELDKYNVDISFYSCTAISPSGVSLYGLDECAYSKHLLKRSAENILVAESTKLGKNSLYTYANITDFSKIIIGGTYDIPKDILDVFENSKTELKIVSHN